MEDKRVNGSNETDELNVEQLDEIAGGVSGFIPDLTKIKPGPGIPGNPKDFLDKLKK